MAQVQYYGTGRRKSSGQVRVPGDGKSDHQRPAPGRIFGKKTLEMIVGQPLELAAMEGALMCWPSSWRRDTGRLGAIRLGIARALLKPT